MNSTIWDELSDKLSSAFRIITVDLPGFGKSPILHDSFTIGDVAEGILLFLEQQGIEKIVVTGHSLGGYVTLAMADKKPELFQGLVLLHSTAYADTPEKKESRSKVIEFIDRHGVETFTSNFIYQLFFNKSHPGVDAIRRMNMQATKEAVTGYTRAMRDRPDSVNVLKKFSEPVLFITGDSDPGIPVASIRAQAAGTPHGEISILPGQAHMSMIEDVQTITELIMDFTERCYS